jgi:hypothetical protein
MSRPRRTWPAWGRLPACRPASSLGGVVRQSTLFMLLLPVLLYVSLAEQFHLPPTRACSCLHPPPLHPGSVACCRSPHCQTLVADAAGIPAAAPERGSPDRRQSHRQTRAGSRSTAAGDAVLPAGPAASKAQPEGPAAAAAVTVMEAGGDPGNGRSCCILPPASPSAAAALVLTSCHYSCTHACCACMAASQTLPKAPSARSTTPSQVPPLPGLDSR